MFRKNIIIYFIIAIIIFLELCLLNILTKIVEKLSFTEFLKLNIPVFLSFIMNVVSIKFNNSQFVIILKILINIFNVIFLIYYQFIIFLCFFIFFDGLKM